MVIQLCAGHWPSVLRVQRAPNVDGSEQREDIGLQAWMKASNPVSATVTDEGRNAIRQVR